MENNVTLIHFTLNILPKIAVKSHLNICSELFLVHILSSSRTIEINLTYTIVHMRVLCFTIPHCSIILHNTTWPNASEGGLPPKQPGYNSRFKRVGSWD